MKKNPKISVIMGVYNSERFLEESINSVLKQDLKDIELIIVDDASTDNSLKILEKYASMDSRMKILANKVNKGLAGALNTALKAASGKYVAVIDSDDVALPRWLSTLFNHLEKNKDAYLVGCGVIIIDEGGREINRWKAETNPKKIMKILETRNALWHKIMFRNTKEFWYREKFRYSQDYDLYTLMLSAGKKIVNIPDFLVKYRVWSGAVSSSKTVYQFLFVRKIAKFYRQRRESGVDGYDSFNPKKILSFDLESLKDKELLEIEIKACWEFNDLKRLRQISLKYFKAHGFAGKITSYYVLSFLGQTIINLLRSLKRHFRR